MTAPVRVCPPLVHGERLSRVEFERRYDAMPELKKAELIDGVVHMPSPVSFRHASPHGLIVTWLGVYASQTPGVRFAVEVTVRLAEDTEVQPDGLLMVDRGGQARIDADDYVSGAPELVVEVAASSVSIDRNAKLRAYQRAGVREYLLWRVEDAALDWFVVRQSVFQPLMPGPDGLLNSVVFAGLWLDPEALLRGDLAAVLAVLQRGLSSVEHAGFVQQLRNRSSGG